MGGVDGEEQSRGKVWIRNLMLIALYLALPPRLLGGKHHG